MARNWHVGFDGAGQRSSVRPSKFMRWGWLCLTFVIDPASCIMHSPLLQKSCQETGNEPRRIFVVAILRRIGIQSARLAADRHPANSQWAPTKAWIIDLTATRHR